MSQNDRQGVGTNRDGGEQSVEHRVTVEGLGSSRVKWLLIGFAIGCVFQAIRMVRMPIDEYHSIRMDLEEALSELDDIRDGE